VGTRRRHLLAAHSMGSLDPDRHIVSQSAVSAILNLPERAEPEMLYASAMPRPAQPWRLRARAP